MFSNSIMPAGRSAASGARARALGRPGSSPAPAARLGRCALPADRSAAAPSEWIDLEALVEPGDLKDLQHGRFASTSGQRSVRRARGARLVVSSAASPPSRRSCSPSGRRSPRPCAPRPRRAASASNAFAVARSTSPMTETTGVPSSSCSVAATNRWLAPRRHVTIGTPRRVPIGTARVLTCLTSCVSGRSRRPGWPGLGAAFDRGLRSRSPGPLRLGSERLRA